MMTKRTNSIKFRSMNSLYCYYQAASQSIDRDDDYDNIDDDVFDGGARHT